MHISPLGQPSTSLRLVTFHVYTHTEDWGGPVFDEDFFAEWEGGSELEEDYHTPGIHVYGQHA